MRFIIHNMACLAGECHICNTIAGLPMSATAYTLLVILDHYLQHGRLQPELHSQSLTFQPGYLLPIIAFLIGPSHSLIRIQWHHYSSGTQHALIIILSCVLSLITAPLRAYHKQSSLSACFRHKCLPLHNTCCPCYCTCTACLPNSLVAH